MSHSAGAPKPNCMALDVLHSVPERVDKRPENKLRTVAAPSTRVCGNVARTLTLVEMCSKWSKTGRSASKVGEGRAMKGKKS